MSERYHRCPAVLKHRFGPVRSNATSGLITGLWVAFVEELPGANSQGATLPEARANLAEAVRLVLEANRALVQEDLEGPGIIREPLRLSA